MAIVVTDANRESSAGQGQMLDYDRQEEARAAPAPAATSEGFDAAALLALARRHARLLLGASLAGAALGYLAPKALTPRFVATTQIYLDPHSRPGLEKEEAGTQQDAAGFINFVESQTRILTSQAVLERVVSAEKLDADAEFGGGAGLLATLLGRLEPLAERRVAATRALEKKISARRPERTFVIDISATASEAEKSARIANAVARAYIDERAAMQAESAKQAAKGFGARLETLRERLLVAERRVEDYKAANGFVGARDQYVDDQTLKDLNQQLTFAEARLEDARARFEEHQRARENEVELAALAATMSLPTLTNLRASQTEALQRVADLSTELGPLHPAVKNAAARAAELKRLIGVELARVGGAMRKDYDRAKALVEGLRRDVAQLREKSLGSARASVSLRDLEREVEVSRGLYESFLARARQTEEAQQIDPAGTHIVSTAAAPSARSFPPGAAITSGAGLLFGAAAGLFVALWRERRASPVAPTASICARPGAARRRLVEEYSFTEKTRFVIRARRGAGVALARMGVAVVASLSDRSEIDVVAARIAELSAARDGAAPRIAFIGAARSLAACNIALALAREGRRVVLIDTRRGWIAGALRDLSVMTSGLVETNEGVLIAASSRSSADLAEALAAQRVELVLFDGAPAEDVDWIVPALGAAEPAIDDAAPGPAARAPLILRFAEIPPAQNLRGGDAVLSAA
jgi:uncharacterized protein involved in exopolysaccharide biosynthesis